MTDFKKVSMNFNPQTIENIKFLSKQFKNSQNNTQVVSTCINVTKEIVKVINEGSKFIVEDKNGNKSEMIFIL
jgi:hypothetical protein